VVTYQLHGRKTNATPAASAPTASHPVKKPVVRKVMGTRPSEDAGLKSGISIVLKAVVHTDNLDLDCTTAPLTDYPVPTGQRHHSADLPQGQILPAGR